MVKKKRKKPIRLVKKKAGDKRYSRLLIFNKPVLGKNHHPFKGKMTDHVHVGESMKIVYRPKELRGLYIKPKTGGKYERAGDYLKKKAKKLRRKHKKKTEKH